MTGDTTLQSTHDQSQARRNRIDLDKILTHIRRRNYRKAANLTATVRDRYRAREGQQTPPITDTRRLPE